jgi:hypothetical protein
MSSSSFASRGARRAGSFGFFGLVALLSAVLGACGEGTPPPSRGCVSSTDCAAGSACVDGRCVARADGGGRDLGPEPVDLGPPRMVTGLAIAPSAPMVTSVDGDRATLDLEALLQFDDGSTAPASSAFWSLADTRLGTIDASTGVFTADGEVAGTVEVRVESVGFTATAPLTVAIERTVIAPGAPADAPARFDAATRMDDPARRAGLLYPLEGAVFPQNVQPPEVQWEGGVAGDLYRVRLEAAGVRVRAFVVHDGGGFRFAWPATREAWRAVAESTPEAPVTVAVDRLESASGALVPGEARTFRFAAATIRGAIYYWDLGGGNILRIRGDGTGLETFMPSPPVRPTSSPSRCVACHAISRNGRRMAAELWDGGDFGAVFDLTADLSVDPAPTLIPPSVTRFLTASFSPDNTRLVANAGTELFLMDGNTGARLPAGGAGLPTTGSAHPTWSPDGTQIAYAAGHDGTWGVDFRRSDLGIVDVTGVDSFGAPRTIASGSGLAVARPTWSPDSALLAYQHSEHSRIREDVGGGAPSIPRAGAVMLVTRDGATQWALEAMHGGARNSYYPTFSPFDEGGYFWLAFVSTRDYGNAQAGTRGTGRRQLWVAAIRNTPTAGADPSAAPYWLPQQDVSHENMAAYWAEEACRADGRTCATSGECCSGFCRDTGGGPVCVPPDVVECSETGEACRSNADCCEGAGDCSANVCSTLG